MVRKAYRDAVLRFHPDRQREASLAQRVRAEEAFKLITSNACASMSALARSKPNLGRPPSARSATPSTGAPCLR